MGGFKAVVTTDLIQYGAIVGIFVLFAFYLLQGTTIPAAEWNIMTAGAKNIFGFFLLGILFPFASPELWQRVYATKDPRTLRLGIVYSVLFYIAVCFLLALVGLAIKTQFPSVDPDIALIYGFASLLPAGLLGLAVVIFFAAFMSSIDTYAYTAASCFVHDFRTQLSKKEMVKAIRWMVTAFIVIMGLAAVYLQDVVLGAFLFAGYVMLLSIPTIATWIRPSISKHTLNFAMIFGILCFTAVVTKQTLDGTLGAVTMLIAIGLSLLGLCLGSLYSRLKKH